MTFRQRINNDYFEWLCEQIDSKRFSKFVSYDKLLAHLHNIEFTWRVLMDENRADDGIQLRRRFSLYNGDATLSDYITGPCSVLEMMAALAIRCEESTMDDTQMGDRTGQWFWGMVHNLGLTPMTNSNFDKRFVDDVIARFLNREYEPNGRGGLFTVKNRNDDLRTVEIWRQLSWYLDSFM
jgi:hypothetical protein